MSSAGRVARPVEDPRSLFAFRHLGRVSVDYLWLAAALGLTALALALRLYHIGDESLWLDEGYTLLFSSLPLDRLFLVGGAHEHPPLYYLIVHSLLAVHNSALLPRVLSAVAGSLCVPALFALGARLVNPPAGLLAAALLALSPFHVWYGRDGRAYELAGLLVLLSYLFLVRALDRPGAAAWVAYALCTALALYTEYTTVFVLAPHLLLLPRARRLDLAGSVLRSWLLAAALFAPWIGTVVLDARSIADNYWIPPPTMAGVAGTVLEFAGLQTPCPSPPCTAGEAFVPVLAGHEIAAALGIIAAVGLALAAAVLRRNLAVSLLGVWLVLPFALVLLLAMKRSLYLDRVFLDATYPFYLLAAAAAVWLARRGPRAALATGLVALAGIALVANLRLGYARSSNPDWRSAAHDLHAAYRPGQAIVYNPGVLRTIVAAYLPAGWRATRAVPLWYHVYLDVPSWQKRYARLVNRYLGDERLDLQERSVLLDAALRDQQLAPALAGARQVWLVTQDYAGFSDTRHWFVAHGFHLLLSELYFDDSRIELWDRGLPRDVGPAALPDDGFSAAWRHAGAVTAADHILQENGRATVSRSFPLTPGGTYIANVEYRGIPPASPLVSVQTYDRSGRVVGTMVDRFGDVLDSFPRTEWYDLPANGVWLSEPFGFVAPAGAVRATIRLQTRWGVCYWRHIAIYRER
ncbi:MAG: glycosyltransferase family 39 protein [Chloroflexi bacterium]|nr:glycosyltransferase family 39 protein [Chloroflexota bacterium]